MSFAHDIVMITDTSVAVGTAIMDSTKPSHKQVSVYEGIGAIAGGRKKSIEEVNISLSKLQDRQASQVRNYKDPLRELVLISETPTLKPDNAYVSNVNILAKEASVLEHVKEVRPEPAGSRKQPLPAAKVDTLPIQPEASSLSTMFQDTKDTVDPVKEKEFLQKLQELEESDSEGFGGEKPVLGKISLIRRAKSAVTRTACEQKTNDRHPLFHMAWEQKEVSKRPATVGATTKISAITVDIEPETAKDEDIITVDDVHSHMKMFHLRKSIPPPEAKLKEEKSGKYSRTRRNKTSKINKSVQYIFIQISTYNINIFLLSSYSSHRVSPSDDYVEQRTKNERERTSSIIRGDSGSSPDPLEPWSTKDLATINQILDS